jgi:hypothetical protein
VADKKKHAPRKPPAPPPNKDITADGEPPNLKAVGQSDGGCSDEGKTDG